MLVITGAKFWHNMSCWIIDSLMHHKRTVWSIKNLLNTFCQHCLMMIWFNFHENWSNCLEGVLKSRFFQKHSNWTIFMMGVWHSNLHEPRKKVFSSLFLARVVQNLVAIGRVEIVTLKLLRLMFKLSSICVPNFPQVVLWIAIDLSRRTITRGACSLLELGP